MHLRAYMRTAGLSLASCAFVFRSLRAWVTYGHRAALAAARTATTAKAAQCLALAPEAEPALLRRRQSLNVLEPLERIARMRLQGRNVKVVDDAL